MPTTGELAPEIHAVVVENGRMNSGVSVGYVRLFCVVLKNKNPSHGTPRLLTSMHPFIQSKRKLRSETMLGTLHRGHEWLLASHFSSTVHDNYENHISCIQPYKGSEAYGC